MPLSKNTSFPSFRPFFFFGSVIPNTSKVSRLFFEGMAFFIVLSGLIFIAWSVSHLTSPIHALSISSIDLNIKSLPLYAFYTTIRMLIAVFFSLLFTLMYANLAAKNQRLGQILVPVLDILQSVPVLGYISFTVTGFLVFFPNSMFGPELAVIFAIFTSQAWNMAFSLYQSLRTTPRELNEAAVIFKMSSWQKFWKIELPFAMPGLIWNTMMSMSGGWFFVVASEAISVGSEKIFLPGIGSYIAVGIQKADLFAIEAAIGMMCIVIFLYDQFLFRPLVAWADKFRYESTMNQKPPRSWLLTIFHRSLFIQKVFYPLTLLAKHLLRLKIFNLHSLPSLSSPLSSSRERVFNILWYSFLSFLGTICFCYVFYFLQWSIGWEEFFIVMKLGAFTLLRVIILIVLASLLWVPIGVYIGLRPGWVRFMQPIAQLLAAFPANLLFPLAVILISRYSLNPNIWLSPLMIFGTQWYILFNVIAGVTIFPNDLQEVASNLKVKGWNWWRRVMLPGVFPYFLTGAITATGGAWNASIVAEFVSWGNKSYQAEGLGAYIAEVTVRGDFHRIALGIGMMAFFVVVFNRVLWQPLYEKAVHNFCFDT